MIPYRDVDVGGEGGYLPKTYIECVCGSEILRIEKDGNEYYLSIHEYPRPSSLWDRIKYWWRYLRKGREFSDQMVLDRNEVEKLIKWLEKN